MSTTDTTVAKPSTTDPDVFRALCEALEEAQDTSQTERSKVLRAMVEAAAFCQCPSCEDKDDDREDCATCGGDGFVPHP